MPKQHPHDLIQVLPIDFLVFIYIENPEVKLYFLVYASPWVKKRHYFGELSEVDICFCAHQLDESWIVISVELVASISEALVFFFFVLLEVTFLFIVIPTLFIIGFVNIVLIIFLDWVLVLLSEEFAQVF